VASEGAVTDVWFKLFHNVIVCGKMNRNISWYVQKGENACVLGSSANLA